MSQNAPEFTQDEIASAQSAENEIFLQSQINTLTNRVVTLRAQLNRANAQIAELTPKADVEPGEGIDPN